MVRYQRVVARKRVYPAKKQLAPGIFAGRGAYRQRMVRSQAQGYGAYNFRKMKIPEGTGRALGSAIGLGLGSAFGNPSLGGSIGGFAGEGLQKALRAVGFGEYKVQHNTLLELQAGPPNIVNSSAGVIVRHREYLQNIVTGTSGAFNLQSFPINPGLVSSYPWLAQVASAYEQYKLRGMIYEFKSTSADALNSTNTALGSVIMATEYDASRPVFLNQQQMANHEFANSSRQSASMLHAIECKRSLTPISELWVRTGAVPANDDERLYDMGLFQIATVGGQASNVVIGELWVSYEVEFLKPQLLSGLGMQLLTDHFYSSTGISSSHYFGSPAVATARTGSNLGCVLTDPGTCAFPSGMSEGTYLVVYSCRGGSAALTLPTITYTNCASLALWVGDTVGTPSVNSTSTELLYVITIKITGQSATFAFSGGAFPSSVTDMDLYITQVNGNIIT